MSATVFHQAAMNGISVMFSPTAADNTCLAALKEQFRRFAKPAKTRSISAARQHAGDDDALRLEIPESTATKRRRI
jgi:hypothetical protein